MSAYPSTYTGYQCENTKNLVHDRPVSRHVSLNYIKQPKIALKSELLENRKTELTAKNHSSALELIGKHADEKARVEDRDERQK